ELRLERRVFAGDNMAAMVLEHLEGRPNLDPLPAAEQQVILKALDKDPGRRYPTCQEFVAALPAAVGQAPALPVGAITGRPVGAETLRPAATQPGSGLAAGRAETQRPAQTQRTGKGVRWPAGDKSRIGLVLALETGAAVALLAVGAAVWHFS